MNYSIFALAIVLFSFSSVASSNSAVAVRAQAILMDTNHMRVGSVEFIQPPNGNGLLLKVRVEGLMPGRHGLHLHAEGRCDPENGFGTAAGHVTNVKSAHGFLDPKGPEPGDLPNIFVGKDGIGEIEIFSNNISLTESPYRLLDRDGSSVVIHQNADDYVTQPIGGAGSRVACGVVKAR